MPVIQPEPPDVYWPDTEGTIGVVGVAPWATLDFLRVLYAQVQATKDWHYPRVLCDINTKLPSRGRHLELGERDPSPFIAETIDELARQGATLVVVPCNTAHILYDRWSARAPVPVPSIVDATLDAVMAGGGQRVAVLASASITANGLYHRSLQAAGLEAVSLDPDACRLVERLIAEIKIGGCALPETQQAAEAMLAGLAARELDGVILGCTELAVLEPLARRHFHCVAESNRALAAAALRAAGCAR